MDMKQMMRQAQKMQKELNKAQEEIATMSFEATAGGGMVTAVASVTWLSPRLPSIRMRSILKMSKCCKTWSWLR